MACKVDDYARTGAIEKVRPRARLQEGRLRRRHPAKSADYAPRPRLSPLPPLVAAVLLRERVPERTAPAEGALNKSMNSLDLFFGQIPVKETPKRGADSLAEGIHVHLTPVVETNARLRT
jgi:hypothetical protein